MASVEAEALEVFRTSEVEGGGSPRPEEEESSLSELSQESSDVDGKEEGGNISLPVQRTDDNTAELHSLKDDFFSDVEFLLTGFTEEEVRVCKEVTIGLRTDESRNCRSPPC